MYSDERLVERDEGELIGNGRVCKESGGGEFGKIGKKSGEETADCVVDLLSSTAGVTQTGADLGSGDGLVKMMRQQSYQIRGANVGCECQYNVSPSSKAVDGRSSTCHCTRFQEKILY